ncbi:MAG TPA: DUF6580 family putative transport protein [Candidatus Didemnitutus sp.]|nr:DUF6580 family putative transport protein [Candidatus Didemnitutus sp.]
MKNQRLFDTATMVTIALVALTRLIPHWPNFTPVMAIALMGGAMFYDRMRALIVPIAAMVLSDLALGLVMGSEYVLHGAQPWVYGCVIGISLFGHAIRSWRPTALILGGGTISAVAFFLITNFAVWLGGGMYPMSVEGLIACYAAGLAFYRDGGNFLLNGLVSTVLFSAVIAMVPSAIRATESNSAKA